VRAIIRAIRRSLPARSGLIAIAAVSVVAGIALSAGYATAVQYTSTPEFCAKSCHEMESTVYREYTHSKHFKNGQGMVASCAQCHAPQDNWRHELGNELSGASRLWAHVVDREYLPERFEARRAELAKQVLADFKADNARECKGCHGYANMALEEQSPNAKREHAEAGKSDANCVECHQGVAHKRMEEPASYDLP